MGDTWYLDELFVNIQGRQQYLWRAVDEDGDLIDNRAEVSHQPTRQRERQMRRFKSAAQVQRFASVHGLVQSLFRVADICCGLLTTGYCEGKRSGCGRR